MNQRLIRILGNSAERYPYALEKKFPRILNTIMSLWDKDKIDDYFMELMISKRPNRAGFPPDVAAEIMHLSLVHAAQDPSSKHEDIWETESNAYKSFTPHQGNNWSEPNPHVRSELQKHNIPSTPEGFFQAAETDKRVAVALFLEAKVGTEIRNNRGWTPLIMAAFNGHHEILDLLFQHKPDVNALDMDGNTALHWAAFNGHISCASRLIQHHAKIGIQNNSGCTPLMQAAARNHPDITKLLIENGAALDATADDGYTALHQAAASGYSEIVELLLAQGAATNLRAIDGNTPYTLAVKNKQADVFKLLMPEPGSAIQH